ncbi:hypothetical protein An01g13870 [Aspergillus niger]|uniref:Uncharacterized protein n=2 Tax=Aspergillus niger TaxID=5061 RepID=A2QB47_ASPNC|nr:hypothetical protein An01g13870 [Aspergillus niger]CAK37391.1 hypothetical protein An01g13870 [Aspergillus niger]
MAKLTGGESCCPFKSQPVPTLMLDQLTDQVKRGSPTRLQKLEKEKKKEKIYASKGLRTEVHTR